MVNQARLVVVWALSFVWLLLQPVGAPLVPEAMILPDHLALFCPDVDVCPERISNDWNYTEQAIQGKVACCTGNIDYWNPREPIKQSSVEATYAELLTECSCDDACRQTNNCCFPPSDLHPGSTCLYPTTRPSTEARAQLYQPYRMIDQDVSETFSGNLSESSCLQNEVKIPCGDVPHPPFGTLLPVYSKQLSNIYKNPACAKSHGINDSVIWEPTIFCANTFHPHGSALFQNLEYGILPGVCRVDFVYPGDEKDLTPHTCYRDLTQTCDRDSFQVPERLNMSAKQVRELCESGFISPGRIHTNVFANVFCHICNDHRHAVYADKSKYCFGSVTSRSEGQGLSYLLNLKHFDKGDSVKPNTNVPEACNNGKGHMISSRCQELKCPMNQIRGQDGNCEFMLDLRGNEYTNTYLMVLKIHIEGFTISSNDDFKQRMNELIRLWNKVNPWLQQGKIYCELGDKNHRIPQVKNLLVEIRVAPTRNMPMQTFLRNVKAYLKKRWTISVKGSSIKVHQSFARFAKVQPIHTRDETLYGYPKCAPVYYTNMDPDDLVALNITAPLILLLRTSSINLSSGVSTLYLNKLYYCQQIELNKHEFILYEYKEFKNYVTAAAFYSKVTGQVLLENEFWLLIKPDKEIVARICLSDSGYKPMILTSGAGPINVQVILVLVLACSYI